MGDELSPQTIIIRIGQLVAKFSSSFQVLDRNHPESASLRRFRDELDHLEAAIKSARQICDNPPGLDYLPRIGLASALDNTYKQLGSQLQVLPRGLWQRLSQRISPSSFPTKELDQITQCIAQCSLLISFHVQLIVASSSIRAGAKPLAREQFSLNDAQKSIIAQLRNHKITAFETQIDASQPLCLPGTQKLPLEEIYSWICSPNAKNIFWHVGDTGSGKSTISRTFAYVLHQRDEFGASFFFDNTKRQSRGTQNLCASLAAQLALYQPATASHLCEALKDDPDLLTRSLSVQFSRLITGCIAKSIKRTGNKGHIYVIIDSLDQLEKEVAELLVVILSRSARQCPALKIIVTSSPKAQVPLDSKANGSIQRTSRSSDETETSNKHDVALYLDYVFEIMGRRYRESTANTEEIPPGWPSQSCLDILKEISGMNYTIATVLVGHVWGEGLSRPVERLQRFSEVYRMQPHGPPSSMLQSILDCSSNGTSAGAAEALVNDRKSILGPVAVLQDPLRATAFASLLGLPNPILLETLSGYQCVCGSLAIPNNIVAFVPQVYEIFHSSNWQADTQYEAETRGWHGLMFTNCLRLLSESMKFSSNSDTPAESLLSSESVVHWDEMPTDVSYACLYWGRHLEESGLLLVDADKVDTFLKTYLLKWAAELILMKLPFDSLRILMSLRRTIPRNSRAQISSSLGNAILTLLPWIDEGQAHPSPETSSALNQGRSQGHIGSKNRTNRSGRVPLASELRMMNAGTHIHAVAVSPDYEMVACSTVQSTIQLWDICTGVLLQTLKGHEKFTTCLTFSSDGKLASGSADNTVKIWQTGIGVAEKTLRSHTNMVCSVSYSNGCKLLASGSDDKTVKLWSVDQGTLLQTFFEHSSHVYTVSFTPDSRYLISGSADQTVRMWDILNGNTVTVLEGHTGSVLSTAIDASTDLIASGSEDNTLRIWSLAKRHLMATITSHNSAVTSVRFLRNGSRVVSASDKGMIQIHSTITMGLLYSSRGHQDGMISIAMIPELGLMVSGSYDETMKLWVIADELSSQEDHNALLPGPPQFPEDPADVLPQETHVIENWSKPAECLPSTIEQDDTSSSASQSTLDLVEFSDMSFGQRKAFLSSKRRTIGWRDMADIDLQSTNGRAMLNVGMHEEKDPGPLIDLVSVQLFYLKRNPTGRIASEIRNEFDLWFEWLEYLKTSGHNSKSKSAYFKELKTIDLLLEWWHYEENVQPNHLMDFFKRKAAGEYCVYPTLLEGSYRDAMFGLWRHEMRPKETPSSSVDFGSVRQNAAWHAGAHRLAMATLPMSVSTLTESEGVFRVKDSWMPVSLDPCPWLQQWWKGARSDAHYLWDTEARMTVRNESNSTDYLVVSHTWGRWRIDGDGAQVMGVPWLVPRNTLFDVTMLPEILSQFPFEARYIWFDLVCIPQVDSPLQQQEISKQASIFQNARWAAIWFNRIENWDGIRAAIKWLSKEYLMEFSDASSPTHHAEGRDLDHFADQTTGWATMVQDKTTPFGYNFMHHGEVKKVAPDPWFTSLWTLQEICLRPDMYLCNHKMEVLTIKSDSIKAVPMDHIIALFNSLQGGAIMREQLPLAIHELAAVMALTSVSQVLDMSPIALLGHASQRHCQDVNRAPAIMSALGTTEWYRAYNQKRLHDSGQKLEMIHGRRLSRDPDE